MKFREKKLPKEAAIRMRICPVDTVQPFALMSAPVYVFMKLNAKFISVKAPLDFFIPEEMKRLKAVQLFYLPPFIDSILPFRQAARTILALLSWIPPTEADTPSLPPASYELADAVLRIIGPLWGPSGTIEPYFAAVLANELCELLPSELLLEVRDRDIDIFENAILVSGWAVFLALHLGYCELAFLNMLRLRVFTDVAKGAKSSSDYTVMDELLSSARALVSDRNVHLIHGSFFSTGETRILQKLAARFRRIQAEFLNPQVPVSTIYGEGGFTDV